MPAPQAQPATLLPAKAPLTPAERPPQHANVTYQQGELTVAADNSSLNQILREISRETGIKITGGVADERVFGTYGPSSASEVLNSLLDGTGSNMLLVQSDSTSPGELILTPRQGGVTPPNPNAPGFEDEGAVDDSDSPPPPPPQVQPQQPSMTPATSEGMRAVPGRMDAPPPGQPASSPASTDPSDPNAVKTPQQIFEQLQRLRQQQQQ
jgi:hypothetical protein